MLISVGYGTALVGSGFISSKISHRKTIILSSIGTGAALVTIAVSSSLLGIHLGLIMLGLAAGLYLPSGIATIQVISTSPTLANDTCLIFRTLRSIFKNEHSRFNRAY